MNSSYYKYCIVPQCKSTTIKTPNKLFIYVPNNEQTRKKWLKLARRADAHCLSTNSRMYFCEDHFDIKNITKTGKKRGKSSAIAFPHRKPSEVIEKPKIKIRRRGPRESTFKENKIHGPCKHNPKTLYELCCDVLNKMPFPNPFKWSVYENCFVVNHITGKRLLEFTDPSVMPKVGIRIWTHIKHICESVRKLFSVEMASYFRSVGLPRRFPGTLMNEFKSRTGPPWGIRENFTRCEILRWFRILNEVPEPLDHWDLVWYQRQTFPKYLIGRIPFEHVSEELPKFVPAGPDVNYEITVRRKFLLQNDIPDSKQTIWVDTRHYGPLPKDSNMDLGKGKFKGIDPNSNLLAKYVNPEGLTGKELALARRKQPKSKFKLVTRVK